MPEPTEAENEALDRFGKMLIEALDGVLATQAAELTHFQTQEPALERRIPVVRLVRQLSSKQQELLGKYLQDYLVGFLGRILFSIDGGGSAVNPTILVDGVDIKDVSQRGWGGLHYEIWGEDGWLAKYSQRIDPEMLK